MSKIDNVCKRLNKMNNRMDMCAQNIIASLDLNFLDSNVIQNLISNNIKVFYLNLALAQPNENVAILENLKTIIKEYYETLYKFCVPISFGVELCGDNVRIGKTRNNEILKLIPNTKVILTTDCRFKTSSVIEVLYLTNFEEYMNLLQINDIIFINNKNIQLKVIKLAKMNITCCILAGGELRSYSKVILPYRLSDNDKTLTCMDIENIHLAINYGADFIVVPSVSSTVYYHLVKEMVTSIMQKQANSCARRPLIYCNIDTCLVDNMDKISSIIDTFSGVWMKKIPKCEGDLFVYDTAREHSKPIVLKLSRNYAAEMNNTQNEVYTKADCFCIEKLDKVGQLHTFLQKLRQYLNKINLDDAEHFGTDNFEQKNVEIDSSEVICNCSTLSSYLLSAKVIVCITRTGCVALQLSEMRPPSFIIAVTKSKPIAKKLNLWKYVKPIVYCDQYLKKKNEDPIEILLKYSMEYGKHLGLLETGDMIINCFNSEYECKDEKIDTYKATVVSEESAKKKCKSSKL